MWMIESAMVAKAPTARPAEAGCWLVCGWSPPAEAGGKLGSRLKPTEAIWLSWPSGRSVNILQSAGNAPKI
jgi:hypothetical protein